MKILLSIILLLTFGAYAYSEYTPEQIAEWKERAENGDVKAISEYCGILLDVVDPTENLKEAAKLYKKAYDQGYDTDGPFGYLAVGNIFLDKVNELIRLTKLAESGDAEAQYNLSQCYAGGPRPFNSYMALKLMIKAAEQGYEEAQIYLSDSLNWLTAIGMDETREELQAELFPFEGPKTRSFQRIMWAKRYVRNGNPYIQYNLGFLYMLNKDYREAVKWYRKAAEQGLARAQEDLGLMYARGEGVPQNYMQAYAWYNIAAANWNNVGKEYKAELVKLLTKEQITEAQQLSTKMLEANPKLMGD